MNGGHWSDWAVRVVACCHRAHSGLQLAGTQVVEVAVGGDVGADGGGEDRQQHQQRPHHHDYLLCNITSESQVLSSHDSTD